MSIQLKSVFSKYSFSATDLQVSYLLFQSLVASFIRCHLFTSFRWVNFFLPYRNKHLLHFILFILLCTNRLQFSCKQQNNFEIFNADKKLYCRNKYHFFPISVSLFFTFHTYNKKCGTDDLTTLLSAAIFSLLHTHWESLSSNFFLMCRLPSVCGRSAQFPVLHSF